MAKHNQLGKEGEEIACKHLLEQGYKILERNYRYHRNEVDIIALNGEELIVVEVKSRSNDYFGDPEDFLKDTQIKTIVNVVDAYIQQRDLEVEVRFDIISIVKSRDNLQVNHIKDAFKCI